MCSSCGGRLNDRPKVTQPLAGADGRGPRPLSPLSPPHVSFPSLFPWSEIVIMTGFPGRRPQPALAALRPRGWPKAETQAAGPGPRGTPRGRPKSVHKVDFTGRVAPWG